MNGGQELRKGAVEMGSVVIPEQRRLQSRNAPSHSLLVREARAGLTFREHSGDLRPSCQVVSADWGFSVSSGFFVPENLTIPRFLLD